MGQFFTGDVDQPAAQSAGEVYREAIKAMTDSMDGMYSSDSAYTKLYNALMRGQQSEALSAYNQTLQGLNLQTARYFNPQYATAALNYEKAYGKDYIDRLVSNMRSPDPEYWANYDTQGAEVLADLQKGSSMTDAQVRASQQGTRATQAARGNSYGFANSALEVYNQFMAGENLKAQRQQAAFNFLKSSPYNSLNISSLMAYQPSVSQNAYQAVSPYGYSNAANLLAGASNTAVNQYAQANAWQMQRANEIPAFFTMITGAANGAVSGAMAGAAMGGPVGAIAGGILGGASGGVMGAFSK